MARDIRRSKRGYNKYCKWWTRDESFKDSNELIMKKQPSGTFYAKEEAPLRRDDNIAGGVFMFDKETSTISTPDFCENIKNKDIVLYKGTIWLVVSVQKKEFRPNASEFLNDNDISYDYFIELRRE